MRIRSECYAFTALASLICACGSNDARISGRFAGLDEQSVGLEILAPGDSRIVDSVKTDEKGNFSFKIKLPQGQEYIYNLHSGNDKIPLLIAPGEKITVNSLGDISLNYTVEGSEGSRLMRELTMIMNGGALKLDSLTNIYTRLSSTDDVRRKVLAMEYGREYLRIKREQIAFVVTHASSPAAVYALYQRLPNDGVLFNGETDVIYFRLVADSLEAHQPLSPYLASLRSEISKMEHLNQVSNMFASAQQNAVSYPDIELPDMYGKKIKLSSLNGNVILLEFWSAAAPRSQMLNAELKDIYKKYNDKGFQVYQVSVDQSKPLWVSCVQDQKLPWISVCDFMGTSSRTVGLYNVSAVPANFLIDKKGDIVGKNLFGAELDKKLGSML